MSTADDGQGRPADAAPPTPEEILRWIADAAPTPWFPSAFAAAAGVPRDSLDEPLAELRLAELARVAAWVRGVGQGYALTPAGEACAGDPAVMAKLAAGPPALPPPALESFPATPPPAEAPAARGPAERPVPLDLRPPIVTPALLIANGAWFAVAVVLAWRWHVPLSQFLAGGDRAVLLRAGAVTGAALFHGDWWRLATACFVHVGLLHLFVNMFALGMTGSLAEVLWGRRRLALIYALSGLAGNCLAMGLHPETETGHPVLLAGASGAVWGLLASVVAWLLLFREHLPPALVADWSRRLSLMVVLNVGLSLIPGISWEAHLGGAVGGFVAAGLANGLRAASRGRRRLAAALLALFPFVCLGGLATAMRTSLAWTNLRAAAAPDAPDVERAAERWDAFQRDVRPLVESLRPALVGPVDREVVWLAVRGRQAKDPAVRDELRKQIDALHATASAALAFLDDRPTGVAKVDQPLGRARAFAAAQRDFLGQLRRVLDADGLPDRAAWDALREKRDAAAAQGELYFGPAAAPPAPGRPRPKGIAAAVGMK